jgi:very-short-patch-repair endonuclease
MERQRVLESMGLTLLRFSDSDVKRDISSVLMAIEGWIEKIEQPPLAPFIKGELPT